MHRNDKSIFLLYIEPSKEEKLKTPIDDELTHLMEIAFSEAKAGSANYSSIGKKEIFKEGGWRGWHTTDCGEKSDNHDYLLKNGLITNSLCVFYVRWYRNSISENDWNKLKMLGSYYEIDIEIPENISISKPSTIKDIKGEIEKVKDILIEEISKVVDEEIIKNIMEKGEKYYGER
jgi:hypothetical protein